MLWHLPCPSPHAGEIRGKMRCNLTVAFHVTERPPTKSTPTRTQRAYFGLSAASPIGAPNSVNGIYARSIAILRRDRVNCFRIPP